VFTQDLVLPGERLWCPERVPDVGVLRDDPEGLPLATAADHHRQVPLDRPGQDPQVIERVATAGWARDLLAVKQRSRGRRRLAEPVEPLAEPGPEVQPEGSVLPLEPGAADAHDRPSAADVVDRGEALHCESGVPKGVRADEQAEPDPLGRLGHSRERRVTLEDLLVRVAEDRQEVVPGPDMVVPETFRPLRGSEETRPVAGLAPQRDSQSQVGHFGTLRL